MILSEAFLKDLKAAIEQIKSEHQKTSPKVCALLDALHVFGDKYGKKDLSFFAGIFFQNKLDPLNLFAGNKKMLMADVSTLLVAAYGAILELQGLQANPALHEKIQELALDIVNKGPDMFGKYKKFSKAQKEAAAGGDKPKRLISKFALGGLLKQKKGKNKLFTAIFQVLSQDGVIDPSIDFDKEAPALLSFLFGMLFKVIKALNIEARFKPFLAKGDQDPAYFGMQSSTIMGFEIPGAAEIINKFYVSVFGKGPEYYDGTKTSFLDFARNGLESYAQYSLGILVESGNALPLERLYKAFIASELKSPAAEDEAKAEIGRAMNVVLAKDEYVMDLDSEQETPKNSIALCNAISGIANKDIRLLLTKFLIRELTFFVMTNFNAGMNVSGYITRLCAGIKDKDMVEQIKFKALDFIFDEVTFGGRLAVSGAPAGSLKALLLEHHEYILEKAEGKASQDVDVSNFERFVKILEVNKELGGIYADLYVALHASSRSSSLSSAGSESLPDSLSSSPSPITSEPRNKILKS